MTGWPNIRKGLMGLFLLATMLVLAACEGGGSDDCGGVDATISCVTISGVTAATRDVDAFEDCDGNGFLDFDRNDVTFTFNNTSFPTAEGSSSVTIQGVSISYSLNGTCPGAACPPLDPVALPLNAIIPEDGAVSVTVPLVDIQTKIDYVSRGGDATAVPSYTASYSFSAKTNFFEDTFDVDTNVPFNIGDFNDSCS